MANVGRDYATGDGENVLEYPSAICGSSMSRLSRVSVTVPNVVAYMQFSLDVVIQRLHVVLIASMQA
jgi:hypothetical protein